MNDLEPSIITLFGEQVPLVASPKLLLKGVSQDTSIDLIFYLDGKPLYRINVFYWDEKQEARKDALGVDAFAVFNPLRMDLIRELNY